MVNPTDIPMLYKRAPFDNYHAVILNALQDGRVTMAQSAAYFDIPGVGFHRSLWTLTLHLVEHRRHGQQTFIVPEIMQGALARTSLAGTTVDDLRLPYPCLYLALPDHKAEIWGGRDTLWHQVRGIFARHEKGPREVKLPNEKPVAPEDDRGVLHLYLWGEENGRSQHQGDDASLWVSLDFNEMAERNEDLEAYLNRIIGDRSRETKDHLTQDDPDLADRLGFTFLPKSDTAFAKQRDAVLGTLRVLFNALLYMDSDSAELERDPESAKADIQRADLTQKLGRMKNPNKNRGKRLRKQIDELPSDTVTWVGRNFRYAKTPSTGAGSATGISQRVHWVRGHWWPRRDTIRHRIRDARIGHATVMQEYNTLKTLVAEAETPEDTSKHLTRLASVRSDAQTAEGELETLSQRMEAKRRWVKPYQKGSRGTLPETHTYIVGDSQ